MDRIKKLKLGWLFPYSGIFRNLKNDLKQGLEIALQKESIDKVIESYPEFVQTGSFKDTEDALKKLLLFEQVDLVIGVASTKVALGALPLLDTERTPVIILNLGADIPTREFSSDYLFYNSLHLWKSEWVMGKWAQQKFGGEPSINMSVYEGGYGLHESFKTGTSISGAQTVKLNILKNISSSPPDTSPLIEYIRQQEPNHAHALLSGKEGDQFLQLFREQDLGAKVNLTVSPFMVEDGSILDIPSGNDLHNASTWSLNLDREENNLFRQLYTATYGEDPNAFSLLAYETGLALAAAIQYLTGTTPNTGARINKDELARALAKVKPQGPRGEISLSTRPLQTNMPVYIRKSVKNAVTGRLENKILEAEPGIEWNDPSLATGESYLTGWQNPYLCV
jgi:branched-chain amino acid transport system substrate-binding protein